MSVRAKCPLCSEDAVKAAHGDERDYFGYRECSCGLFYIWHYDEIRELAEGSQRANWHPRRLSALLRELRAKRRDGLAPFLQLGDGPYKELRETFAVRGSDLLTQWPRSVPERIERCFCHLIRSQPDPTIAGREIDISGGLPTCPLIFAEDIEREYFVRAMCEYEWATKRYPDVDHGTDLTLLTVTPTGWAKFHELAATQSDAKNHAFVAMWFGGEDQKKDMDSLYRDAIKPAVKAAGYWVKRADTDEHNEPIMDRVIEDIRKAPFVIAELTKNRNGVYYEAGFARGRGIEVIYCCPTKTDPHFDVSGINQVRWKDNDDLRKRLESRILGTIGTGPHPFVDLAGSEG